MKNLTETQGSSVTDTEDNAKIKENLIEHTMHQSALACNNIRNENFNLDKEKQKNRDALAVLGANDGLQAMLTAQMLSIHAFQQKSMIFAQALESSEDQKYYINAGIKLANCFVQQATLLAKLQGIGDQKIIVERVDVHNGGQAVVGSIQGGKG